MIFIFFTLVGIGLLAAILLIRKELERIGRGAGIMFPERFLKQKFVIDHAGRSISDLFRESSKPASEVAPPLSTPEQKYFKMEQLLQEKNKLVARLENDLKSIHGQQGDIEALRRLLQEQIEELRSRNRTLKAEMEQVLKENLSLRTKLGEMERLLERGHLSPIMHSEGSFEAISGESSLRTTLPRTYEEFVKEEA